MKVVKADYSGACYGVQRALDIALHAPQGEANTYTLGPLIHNPTVVHELALKGVHEIGNVDGVRPEDTVIIRSHGVTPAVMRTVLAKTPNVLDATCPFVDRAQKASSKLAKKYGCVVVVGEEGHPEVEGLIACAREAGGEVVAVSSAEDIPSSIANRVGVVVQTTQELETLEAVVEELASRGVEADVANTICTATRQRQDSAAGLAREVDAIVVIGGRNSSNTTRLASICKEKCSRTYHIESPDEIDAVWFDGCSVVGVTAGASTPEVQIAAVIKELEAL